MFKREPFEAWSRPSLSGIHDVHKYPFEKACLRAWLGLRCGIDSKSRPELQSAFEGLKGAKFYSLSEDMEKAVGVESAEIILRKHLT